MTTLRGEMNPAESDSPATESDNAAHRVRILVVDDLSDNLVLLSDVLSGQGFDVMAAESGQEALRILEQTEIDIIISDAMMPVMDGFQLCHEVKRTAKYASLPFVIYTGHYVTAEDQEFARSIGVDAYVMKFDGLEALLNAISDLVRDGRRARLRDEAVQSDVADELTFLRRHHALIIKKLEEKTRELEKQAEELAHKNREIRASEARYRSLFEFASIGIFILNKEDGSVVDVNAEGSSLLGYTRNELNELPPLSFVEDQATVTSILQSGAFFSKETAFRRKDGAVVEVELAVGPYADQSDKKLVLYALDITEQKKMRQHLLQSEKMALMGRLAASIAHDIRNPLAAITLNLQYLSKRLPPEFPDRGALDFAIEGARKIGKIIENTLNLARVTPPIVKPEQINSIVEEAIRFLEASIEKKNITIQKNLAEGLPPVHVEAKQIEQVVLNLVQNAVDCTPENGVITVSTCLHENLTAHDSKSVPKVAVVILDRGPGIPPDQLRHLFEPFHTTKVGGTGLGLALSKQIMDKHGAEIRIEPAVGGGTIARLIFPIVQQ